MEAAVYIDTQGNTTFLLIEIAEKLWQPLLQHIQDNWKYGDYHGKKSAMLVSMYSDSLHQIQTFGVLCRRYA